MASVVEQIKHAVVEAVTPNLSILIYYSGNKRMASAV